MQILLVDDNEVFRTVLARSLRQRLFKVDEAGLASEALDLCQRKRHSHAILDLNLGQHDSALSLIPQLLKANSDIRIVLLTGYASIATAIEAIRLGAMHYLEKPSGVDEILDAFEKTSGSPETPISPSPMTVEQLEWEHLQRTLMANQGNISSTARILNLHRRTLQRKLRKHAVW